MTKGLLLINPNSRVPSPYAAIEPPLWLGMIAGYHLAQGERVGIVDAEAEDLTIEETAQWVIDLRPRETIVVVMGNNPSVSSTPKMPVAQELLKYISNHTPVKLTGLHPVAMDYPGAVKHPFEGCPSIPWNLLPMDKYKAHNWHCLENLGERSPYGVLYTSLNCPFNCFYCNVHALYGDKHVRWRPWEDIARDLMYFASHGIRNIKIWDELFCWEKTRAEQVLDFIWLNHLDFNIWAYAHVSCVNEFLLAKMKKAGMNWLAYGFESGRIEVRKKVHKGFTDSTMQQAIQMTRDAGINIMANFLFGLPGETEDDMKATLDFALEQNFEYVNFYVALPYPGSPWYASLAEKSVNWASFNQFSPAICAAPQVVRFRDEAFQTYFSRPEYLSMVRRKFGLQAEAHIKEMLAWKIR